MTEHPERPDRPRIGRKGNKKVRTGCRTCKIRKVKCDETRPVCLRCVNSGRLCDGYAPVPPRARRTVPIRTDSDSSTSPGDSSAESALIVRSPSALHHASKSSIARLIGDSKSTLAQFHRRTAPRLAGFMDDYFWNELVLQIGDVEPAVRHAISAVSYIYDYCEARGAALPEPEHKRLLHPAYAAGLLEYNTAITELVHRPKGTHREDESVHLICCVLFVCIEMLGNERQAAMAHFDQGLALLSAYGSGKTGHYSPLKKADVVRETLAPIFRRLSLQAIMFGRDPPLIPLFAQMYAADDNRYTAPFRTLKEAVEALVALMDQGLRMAHDVIGLTHFAFGAKYDAARWDEVFETMMTRRQQLKLDLDKWLLNFSPLGALTVATSSTDLKLKLGCNIMRVQHQISVIWITAMLDKSESVFDKFTTEFAMIVHWASDILHIEKALMGNSERPVFVFEMGVVAPLYFTASKCRQRRIRRAALILLQNWPRRENLWEPKQTSRAVKMLITIEDEEALNPDAPDDVWPPEWKRIHKMDHEDYEDEEGNTVTVAVMHRKPCGLDSEWEIIREELPPVE